MDCKLKKMGYQQASSDPCLHVSKEEMSFMAVYVDDIRVAGKGNKRIEEVKKTLGRHCAHCTRVLWKILHLSI